MKTIRCFAFTLLVAQMLLVAGCFSTTKVDPLASTSGTPAARDGLLDLCDLLKEVKGGKVPMTNNDLAQHDAMHPAAFALTTNGTIVYLFGASVNPAEKELKLVGMQKDADKTGGWVLLSNGEVKDLPASEVAALPAGGKMPKK